MQSSKRLFIITIALCAFLLVGCGVSLGSDNWAGISSDGDTVYVSTGESVVAIDIADQNEKWSYQAEGNQVTILAAPGLGDSAIYLADYGESQGMLKPGVNTSVYAVNPSNGTLIWRTQGVATDRIIAPPLEADGYIFIGTAENSVVTLDLNGNIQWTQETDHAVWGQPSYADGVVVVASMDRHVYAFDAASGNELWKTSVNGAAASKPIIDDDRVYVSSFDSKVHALDLNSGDELWTAAGNDWIWNAPVVAEGNVYFADAKGGVHAADAENGNIIWTKQFGDGDAIEAGLVVENGTVYAPVVRGVSTEDTQSGRIVALAAADGTQLWEVNLDAPAFSTPVIADGNLVVAQQNKEVPLTISVIGLDDGQNVWRYEPNAKAE